MKNEFLLSSDSHVMEPPDLWKTRMNARKYGDRIPQVVREGSNDFWYVDGVKLMSAARAGAQAGVRFSGNLNLREDAPFDDVFPGLTFRKRAARTTSVTESLGRSSIRRFP